MSNLLSVLLFREEVIKAKANNLFTKDSTISIHAVPFRDVTRIISQLSFALLVIRGFSMTKVASRSVANPRQSLLLLLED